MYLRLNVSFLALVLCFGLIQAKEPENPHPVKMATKAQKDFYRTKIHPILKEKCIKCHGQEGKKVKGEFYVTSRAGLLRGGEVGPALNIDNPAKSNFLAMISYKDEDHEMPPKNKLPDETIKLLTEWVKMGAPFDPALEMKLPEHQEDGPTVVSAKTKNYWAYRKLIKPTVPSDSSWSNHTIDKFLYDKLKQAGLKPNGPAKKQVLIRRAYYDLTGLPPSPQDVEAFINDQSPDAYAKLIDRLLASPQYGEKWGRHWLDLVRFAESNGYERDALKPEAFRYRDYVIKSFNEDKP